MAPDTLKEIRLPSDPISAPDMSPAMAGCAGAMVWVGSHTLPRHTGAGRAYHS